MDDFIVLTEKDILHLRFIHNAGIILGLKLANPEIKGDITLVINKNFDELINKFRNGNLVEYEPKIY